LKICLYLVKEDRTGQSKPPADDWDESRQTGMGHKIFSIAVTGISRFVLLRDRLAGKNSKKLKTPGRDITVTRTSIPSGDHLLDAVLVKPELERARLLICHGIGETVGHWTGVQHLLAEHGVGSLVFDYSGYGRSTGIFQARQAESDAISAFQWFQQLTPALPISVLGFSLGSGVAGSIIEKVEAKSLILCAAFTSLRQAAVSCGVPKRLSFVVPEIWQTVNALRAYRGDVLIVHGDRDRLFPTQMANALFAVREAGSKLVIVPDLSHDEPYRRPEFAYWKAILEYI
jgi:alpha/beta superfamily hydrolase